MVNANNASTPANGVKGKLQCFVACHKAVNALHDLPPNYEIGDVAKIKQFIPDPVSSPVIGAKLKALNKPNTKADIKSNIKADTKADIKADIKTKTKTKTNNRRNIAIDIGKTIL